MADPNLLSRLRECEPGSLGAEAAAAILELAEYAEHRAWRCAYRSRYGRCVCGLDERMAAIGLPPVPVTDPEA